MSDILATNRRAIADGADWPAVFMQNGAVYALQGQGPAALDELDRAYGAGWRDGANVPRDNRVTDQARRTATFLYERLGPGNETARWNCREVAREDTSQCIPGTS